MTNRRRYSGMILWGILMYGSMTGALYAAQRSLIYHPDRNVPSPRDYRTPDAVVRTVRTDDGITLTGWHWPATRKGAPTIIWFHGNAGHHGDRVSIVPAYVDKGYGVLLASYRGYGGNGGAPTEEGLYRDARAWMRFMQDSGVTIEDVVIYGESLGSGIAVQMALEHPDARALVLQAPYTSLPDVAARTYFFVPVHILMKDQFRSIDKIGDVRTKLLVFMSTDDRVIAPAITQRLYDAARVDKKLITFSGFGHNDMPVQERADALQSFLED